MHAKDANRNASVAGTILRLFASCLLQALNSIMQLRRLTMHGAQVRVALKLVVETSLSNRRHWTKGQLGKQYYGILCSKVSNALRRILSSSDETSS